MSNTTWTERDTAMLVNSLEHAAREHKDSPKLRKHIADLVVQAVHRLGGRVSQRRIGGRVDCPVIGLTTGEE